MARIREVKEIPLRDLTIGRGQVRLRHVSKEINELADSIRAVGLLEPIVVCETEEAGRYEIITGQRRFLAHQELHADKIMSAILDERVDEQTAKVLSVTENLVRRDLDSKDLIDACTYLFRKYGSIRAVSEETGLAYQKVSKYVKYDQLIEPLRELVDNGTVKLQTALRAQRAASVSGDVNPEEAVEFAIEMQPLSGIQQSKMIETREDNPHLPSDVVIEDAKQGGKVTQTLVTLTTIVHASLRDYARAEDTNLDDAASMLIQEGLAQKGYLDGS